MKRAEEPSLEKTKRRARRSCDFWQWYSRVSVKISVVDRFNQLLRDLDDLLFTSCRQNKRHRQTVNGEEAVRR